MKGRLLVVDDESLKIIKENKIWGPRIPELGENWDITIIDIVSDMLNFQIGDYVILWKTKSCVIDSSEFYGVYRVISKPYIDTQVLNSKDENPILMTPFKIQLEEAYKFDNPIQEYDFINDINIKNDIWTIVGKKVKGKARASTPITEEIIQLFIKKFIDINNNWIYTAFTKEVSIPSDKLLFIDLSKKLLKPDNNLTIEQKKQNKINQAKIFKDTYNMDLVKLVTYDGSDLRCEKVLEGILNQHISNKSTRGIKDNKDNIVDKLINKNESIKWYFNYLPYGLEGTEIDYMISLTVDGVNTSRILVLEFMKGTIDEDHIERAFLYSKWVNTALCDNSKLTEPIVISHKIPKKQKLDYIYEVINKCKAKYDIEKFRIYNYVIENNELKLTEHILK